MSRTWTVEPDADGIAHVISWGNRRKKTCAGYLAAIRWLRTNVLPGEKVVFVEEDGYHRDITRQVRPRR